jgi:hypothetical protein
VPLICRIGALPGHEVGPYVQARLNVAHASREIFSAEALAVIAAASGGVPRLINAICDMAMVYAFAQGSAEVDRATITRIVSEGRSSGFGALALLTPQFLSIEEQNDSFPTRIEDEVAPAFSSEMKVEPELIEIRSADVERDTRDCNTPTPPGAEISDQSIPIDVETLPSESKRANASVAEQGGEIAEPEVLPAWPSISGRRIFPTNTSPGGSMRSPLRRRFLPRI